jgi:hypothetical protein
MTTNDLSLGFDRACGVCVAEYQLAGSDAVVASASFAQCDVGNVACALCAATTILRHAAVKASHNGQSRQLRRRPHGENVDNA